MNHEIKQKWVAALRSEEFKQGYGSLKQLNWKTQEINYCCLGVLCEILHPERFIDRKKDGGLLYTYKTMEGAESTACLPFELLREVELSRDQENHLIKLNDSPVPFSQIAQYIEENL